MRKFIFIILILILIILFFGYIYFYNEPRYISVEKCPDNAKSIIQKNNISLIHSCEEEEILLGGKEVFYVAISYGPASCGRSCRYRYRHYSIMVDGEDFAIFWKPTKWGLNDYIQIFERYGPACKGYYKKSDVHLVYEDGQYKWKIIYNNLSSEDTYGTQCILNGYEIIGPSEGHIDLNVLKRPKSYLNLVVEYPKISTCSEEIVEKAIFDFCDGKKGCIGQERQHHYKVGKDQCLRDIARIKMDPNICEEIIHPTYKAYCYYGIALQELNEASCDKITREYVNKKCYTDIKEYKFSNQNP